MAMGRTICFLQHKRNLMEGVPHMPASEFGLQRTHPIAIVGGGPSLAQTLPELRAFRGPIMAAGSAHDYLMEQGIEPTYAVVLDPDPLMAAYLKRPSDTCRYLVASHVAPHVLYALAGKQVYLFGAGGTFDLTDFENLPVVMVGGRTVGTRAMGMALGLGYTEMHLFGMDSCLDGRAVHAYEITEDAEFDEVIRQSARVVYCNGKTFRCASYMLGQATDFQRFMGVWGDKVSVEVHGEGLLAEIMKAARSEDERRAA